MRTSSEQRKVRFRERLKKPQSCARCQIFYSRAHCLKLLQKRKKIEGTDKTVGCVQSFLDKSRILLIDRFSMIHLLDNVLFTFLEECHGIEIVENGTVRAHFSVCLDKCQMQCRAQPPAT